MIVPAPMVTVDAGYCTVGGHVDDEALDGHDERGGHLPDWQVLVRDGVLVDNRRGQDAHT